MKRPLLVLAWLNVALHVAGLAFAAFGMRPEMAGQKLEEYLRWPPIGWTFGWLTWMLCAGALIVFLANVVSRLPLAASLARLGLTFAVVGLGFDLLCDLVYIFVLPDFASGHTPYVFRAVQRTADFASLFIANGCYSIGILLIARDMHYEHAVRPVTTAVGHLVAAGGILLAATVFPDKPVFTALAAAPTIGLFCVWAVLVARDLERPA